MNGGKINFWTLLIPLVIGVIFVALDIWPGKALRTYRVETVKSNRALVGAFGQDDWEWVEEGKGYRNGKGEVIRHGRWVETCRDRFSGVWRCEGEYKNGNRNGRWIVSRDDELFREYIFDRGKLIRVRRKEEVNKNGG